MREYYIKLAEELNLMISGGTDYHGHEIKPDIDIGYGRNNNTRIEEQSIGFLFSP